tara:strand:+ start:1027 stop:1269 length:243 start_codon:yes stop_codon:yes gene_type:complete
MDTEFFIDIISKVGVPSAGLLFLLNYLTRDLSNEIKELNEIIVALINRMNRSDANRDEFKLEINKKLNELEKEIARHWKD